MDNEDAKQIIIAYYAIGNAIDAILKPIRIELRDTETAQAMYDGLDMLRVDCERIQATLGMMNDYISALENDLDADEELADAGDMIRDILFDIKPIPNQPALDEIADSLPPETNMVEFAGKVVMGEK